MRGMERGRQSVKSASHRSRSSDFNFLTGAVLRPEKDSSMATTPTPDEGVKQELQRNSTPASPVFWGRRPAAAAPVVQAPRGPQPYPKMMYYHGEAEHLQGAHQVAQNAEEEKEAIESGWTDKPGVIHLELLQGNGKQRLPTSVSDLSEKKPAKAKS